MTLSSGYERSLRLAFDEDPSRQRIRRLWIPRARCRNCRIAPGLLPAFCLLRRLDPVEVIGGVLASVATGHPVAGRFLSVLPRSRKEDGAFRDWVRSHAVNWVLVKDNGTGPGGIEDLWAMAEAPWPSAEGYRVMWVSSSAKAARDAEARRAKIAAVSAKLADLATRLGGPKARIRTIDGAEAAVEKTLGDVARFFTVNLKAITETTLRRIRKDSSSEGASFRPIARTRIECSWSVDDDQVRAEAASDGMFPLITNCRQMPLAEILAHYQWQPCLERQHHHLKSMNVSAMFVKCIARVEALLFLYFIGLLVRSLIEREVRRLMKHEGIVSLPLYPEERDCSSPTAERILASFADICRHGLAADGKLVQSFEPKLDSLQCRLLKLLGLPASLYDRPGASGLLPLSDRRISVV